MRYKILEEDFYKRNTLTVARELLGKLLVHQSEEGTTSGIIVETEAYLSIDDPACHAFRGMTKRNSVMFGPPGRAYVYFIYGNHYCFNVVTSKEGIGEAVLIRALEPLEGLDLMIKRRGAGHSIYNLTSGPGKLCAAMAISRKHNGISLLTLPLFIADGKKIKDDQIGISGRIGIKEARDKPWRFFLEGNPFVSRLG